MTTETANADGTAALDLSGLVLAAYRPYVEVTSTLQRLRAQRAETETALKDATQAVTQADTSAVQAEAAAMIGEGDKRSAATARARLEQTEAKATEAARQLRTLDSAIAMQEQKVAVVTTEARAHVARTARSLHEPIMQRLVHALREAADAAAEHEALRVAVIGALGRLGGIVTPTLPDLSLDRKQGDAFITGIVDEVARELRLGGYDV